MSDPKVALGIGIGYEIGTGSRIGISSGIEIRFGIGIRAEIRIGFEIGVGVGFGYLIRIGVELGAMMLRIDSHKESKFDSNRSILMENLGLISLLKLFISIQQLILISELTPILESILNPEPIPIQKSIPEPILEPTAESASGSTPESAPESGRFDSVHPPPVATRRTCTRECACGATFDAWWNSGDI